MSLTVVELEVLRDFGLGSCTWLMLRIIAIGADALKGQQGGSCGQGYWLDYDSKGITRTRPLPAATVTRQKLAAWRLTLPAGTYLQAAELSGQLSKNQREYPMFYATAAACGCGPKPTQHGKEGPITHKQWLYEQEHDVWYEQRYLPWQATDSATKEAARLFLETVLTGDEQTALFDVAGVA